MTCAVDASPPARASLAVAAVAPPPAMLRKILWACAAVLLCLGLYRGGKLEATSSSGGGSSAAGGASAGASSPITPNVRRRNGRA